jgi:dihydroxyacid dehydratase (EC 4.2.1.9)
VAERRLAVDLSEAELERRLDDRSPPEPQYTNGVLAKYAALFGSAADGAVSHVMRDE